jgi:small nuclear ribonucleoprotein (snRNP)-like protein
MASVAERKFMEELSILLQKTITVQTASGKSYTGILSGVDANTMNICLSNARDETGQPIHKLFLNGQTVLQILSVEKPFDLRSLAERLERVFPRMVKTIEEAGVIVVMDKIRITEKGIIEGSGPAAERVQKVYDEFMKERAK